MGGISKRPIAPSQDWILTHAEAYGRAIELAHKRYRRVRPDDPIVSRGATSEQLIDGYVEYLNWITGMRRMCRVAEAARAQHDPLRASEIAAAVGGFEATVICKDVIHVRDVLEHADDYGAGIGQKRIRFPDIDMDAWTDAALKFRADLVQALRQG